MKTIITAFLLSIFFSLPALAQSGKYSGKYGNSAEDSIECVQNLSLYIEFYKQENYRDALVGWRWCFNNCPKSSKKLYAYGAKMFRCFAEEEQDEQIREKYIDTVLMNYDQRITHFGQEGFVLGLKGVSMMNLRRNEAQQAYEVLSKSIAIQGNESKAGTITYLYLAGKILANEGKLTSEELRVLFDSLIDIIKYQCDKQTSEKKKSWYIKAKGTIEKLSNNTMQPSEVRGPGACGNTKAKKEVKTEKKSIPTFTSSDNYKSEDFIITTSGLSEKYASWFKSMENKKELAKMFNLLEITHVIAPVKIKVSYENGSGYVVAECNYDHDKVLASSTNYAHHNRSMSGFGKGKSVWFEDRIFTALSRYKKLVATDGYMIDDDLSEFKSAVKLKKANNDWMLFYGYNYFNSRGFYPFRFYKNVHMQIGGIKYEAETINLKTLNEMKYFYVGKTTGLDGNKTGAYFFCQFFGIKTE